MYRMKKLIKNRKQWLSIAGVMMVVCAIVLIHASLTYDPQVAGWQSIAFEIIPWLFFVAAVVYAIAQRGIRPHVSSDKITICRLFRIQTFSHILMILAGLLMIENYNQFLMPLFVKDINSYQLYIQIVMNNWAVYILLGGILQVYSELRLSSELKGINNNEKI